MGLGLRLLGGALQGVGSGLAIQAQNEVTQRREMAMEQLRAKNRQDEMASSADLQDRNAGRAAARGDFYGARDDARQAGYRKEELGIQQSFHRENREDGQKHQLTLAEVEQKHRVALESLSHQHRMTQEATAFARQTEQKAREAGQYVDRWEVSKDGSMVGLNAKGEIISQSDPGMFDPYGSRPDEGGGGIGSIAAARAARGGVPAAAAPTDAKEPQGKGQAPAKSSAYVGFSADLARLQREYDKATAQSHPGLFRNGRKLPFDEAHQRLKQAHGL